MKKPFFQKQPVIVEKGWGKEIIFVNNDSYCGKLLVFNEDSTISMHYHLRKTETWYISEGEFTFKWFDVDNAELMERNISRGDIIHLSHGVPHQLTTKTGGTIFEVSTPDDPNDSYRIIKGDSQ